MNVAILGTGVMGGAMARNARRAGHEVHAWSVPLADAERLAPDGVVVDGTAAGAAARADVCLTMVPDLAAIETFADEFLAASPPHAVWVQSSTVGIAGAERTIELAAKHGRARVDAPVLGTREPAERGALTIFASGDDAAIDRCLPFFDAVATRVLRVGPAGAGSRLKLVVNSLIVAAGAAVSETFALAEALGVDGALLEDATAGVPIDAGYTRRKWEMMRTGRYEPPTLQLRYAAKDAHLVADAAHAAGLPARVADAAAALYDEGCGLGHDELDMAAAYLAAARRT
jgi:3-hydroxyisobutyrate dehydrogenase